VTTRLVVLVGLSCMAAVTAQEPQVPTFRSRAEAVLVDVSVVQGGRPVSDLTAADFLLLDNKVRQTIESVSDQPRELEIALIVDVSQSIRRLGRTRAREIIGAIRGAAREGDDVRLYRLASGIRRAASPDDLWIPLAVEESHTSLLDGLAAALIQSPQPGRRRVIIALTDGLDTTSVLPSNVVAALADRSQTPIHLVAINEQDVKATLTWMFLGRLPDEGFNGYFAMMGRVADGSGGRFYDIRPEARVEEQLLDALGRMRTGYLLRYVPRGVPASGWHEVSVKIDRPGRFDVEHRRGYFADDR
jgi:hypothetical protein